MLFSNTCHIVVTSPSELVARRGYAGESSRVVLSSQTDTRQLAALSIITSDTYYRDFEVFSAHQAHWACAGRHLTSFEPRWAKQHFSSNTPRFDGHSNLFHPECFRPIQVVLLSLWLFKACSRAF